MPLMLWLRSNDESAWGTPTLTESGKCSSRSSPTVSITAIGDFVHTMRSVESLGAELDSVVITDLRDHTYYASLRVRHEGELVEIDSRPSDAIAVAVTCDPPLPIYVSEEVLEDAPHAPSFQKKKDRYWVKRATQLLRSL